MSDRVDVAIIGTGPAGISAAITLSIRNKSILLFGNPALSPKVDKAEKILNYPGLPNVTGLQLNGYFKNHIDSLGIEVTDETITTVYDMQGYFSMQTKKNAIYEAKSVIIATGISFGKPYKNEEDLLGRGVSYCATCDAAFYKDKDVAVIAETEKEVEEALFLSEGCSKVYYIPLYDEGRLSKSDAERGAIAPDRIELIGSMPLEILGEERVSGLKLKAGEIAVDGVFILRDSISPGQIIYGLEMENNSVRVDRGMRTNIPGVFACGDITGTPYQYVKSAGEGNVAALSAVSYLNESAKEG